MRAYVRSQSSIDMEISGKVTRDLSPDTRPAGWAEFCRTIEAASADEGVDRRLKPTIKRLAHCGSLDVSRSFDCGQEDSALESWCGHAYCPACAESESMAAARFARQNWDARLISVEVPVSGDLASPALPDPNQVATIRASWAKITKGLAKSTGLPRIESVPRVMIAPQSVTIFARFPFGEERDTVQSCMIEALQDACHAGGLTDASARDVSREEAARMLRGGLSEQSRRFVQGVQRDMSGPWPGEVAARGWIEQLKAYHADRRRKRLLGGKGSLAAPSTSVTAKKAICSRHGGACHVITTRVREESTGDLVVSYPGDQVPSSGGPVAAAFFKAAVREGVRHSTNQIEAASPGRARRAG